MTNSNTLGSYQVVSDKVRSVIARRASIESPFGDADDLTPYREVVARGRELLPDRYHSLYIDVLEKVLDQAEASMEAKNGRNKDRVLDQLETVFDVLARPLAQLDSGSHTRELKAYLALASNMFRRFAQDKPIEEKLKSSGYLVDLDPMGFFVGSDRSPFTIAPSKEIPLAFVAKPVQYAGYAPLYIVDAHEVGGHVLQSAISGFTKEVESVVRKSVRKQIRSAKSGLKAGDKIVLPKRSYLFSNATKKVAVSTFLSETFAQWSSEFFCDVCGVLNMGPAYINGLIQLLSQLAKDRLLSSSSVYTRMEGVSSHPTRLLRVLLCLKVLENLSFDGKEIHLDALRKRLEEACGGSLPATVSWVDKSNSKLFSFSLEDMMPVIELTASLLTETSLSALDNRSLLDLMTWGSKDESTVEKLKAELLNCKVDENEAIEARHVVAASVFAVEELSLGKNFDEQVQDLNDCALALMASMFEEQCLFCDRPAHSETRRQDIFKLSKLASLVEKLTNR